MHTLIIRHHPPAHHLRQPRKPYQGTCLGFLIYICPLYPPLLHPIRYHSEKANAKHNGCLTRLKTGSENVHENQGTMGVCARVSGKCIEEETETGSLLVQTLDPPSQMCQIPFSRNRKEIRTRRLFLGGNPSVSSSTLLWVNRGRMISQTRSWVNSSSMNSSKWVKE